MRKLGLQILFLSIMVAVISACGDDDESTPISCEGNNGSYADASCPDTVRLSHLYFIPTERGQMTIIFGRQDLDHVNARVVLGWTGTTMPMLYDGSIQGYLDAHEGNSIAMDNGSYPSPIPLPEGQKDGLSFDDLNKAQITIDYDEDASTFFVHIRGDAKTVSYNTNTGEYQTTELYKDLKCVDMPYELYIKEF